MNCVLFDKMDPSFQFKKILENGKKILEKSGNFVSLEKWEPWTMQWQLVHMHILGVGHNRQTDGGSSESHATEHRPHVHQNIGIAYYTDQWQKNDKENLRRREAEIGSRICKGTSFHFFLKDLRFTSWTFYTGSRLQRVKRCKRNCSL